MRGVVCRPSCPPGVNSAVSMPRLVCTVGRWLVGSAVLCVLATIGKSSAHPRVEASVGLGAIWIWPFGHVEVRYRSSPATSVAAFVSALPFSPGDSSNPSPVLLFVNTGVEARYHFQPSSSYDPHVGAGAGMLFTGSDQSVASTPWVWANAGVTLRLGSRLQLDLEVSPVVAVGGDA